MVFEKIPQYSNAPLVKIEKIYPQKFKNKTQKEKDYCFQEE